MKRPYGNEAARWPNLSCIRACLQFLLVGALATVTTGCYQYTEVTVRVLDVSESTEGVALPDVDLEVWYRNKLELVSPSMARGTTDLRGQVDLRVCTNHTFPPEVRLADSPDYYLDRPGASWSQMLQIGEAKLDELLPPEEGASVSGLPVYVLRVLTKTAHSRKYLR